MLKSVEQDNKIAQALLGAMQIDGTGVEIDYTTAAFWLELHILIVVMKPR